MIQMDPIGGTVAQGTTVAIEGNVGVTERWSCSATNHDYTQGMAPHEDILFCRKCGSVLPLVDIALAPQPRASGNEED